ncbi:MAG: hypothetical protein KA535_05025 [Azonexus sp.]|nr:hypothetical protein [Azonexus sp.]
MTGQAGYSRRYSGTVETFIPFSTFHAAPNMPATPPICCPHCSIYERLLHSSPVHKMALELANCHTLNLNTLIYMNFCKKQIQIPALARDLRLSDHKCQPMPSGLTGLEVSYPQIHQKFQETK